MEQTLWHKSLLEKSEHDIRLAAFRERFGVQPEYWHLALYAAFPPALTFDLLAKIAQNFPLPTSSFKSQIVVLTPDVLMSPLCEPLGHGMYEMYSAPRKILLNELRNVQPQDEDIFRQLGFFLDQYRRECLAHIPTPALEEAFRFVALAHTDALKAATEYLNAYETKKTGARIMRRLSAGIPAEIEANRAPGHPLAVAMELTRGIDLFEAGEVEEGAEVLERMSDYIDMKAPEEIAGIRAQVPASMWSFLREHAAWREALWLGTAEAFSRYLDEYPEGRYAAQAEERIDYIERKWQEMAKDEAAWQDACKSETIEAFTEYIRQHPNGRYVESAKERITTLESSKSKAQIITDIRANSHYHTPYQIRELLSNGLITSADLEDAGIISREALDILLNPPEIFSTLDWSDLPPPKEQATDIYFLGVPSSGKSCLLSGILYHADKAGALELETENRIGLEYGHSLIRSIKTGYVPPATPMENILHIPVGLYDEEERRHPINFMEMSGELFTNTHRTASINTSTSLGASGYLLNKNRKIIFLVIDYGIDSRTYSNNSSIASQGIQIATVLKLLDKNGILVKTDALFLVISKSDLLPGGASNLQAADAFVNSQHLILRNYIRRLSEKYGFYTGIYPFSLGKFMLERTFQYDPKYSEVLLREITELSFTLPSTKRKGRGWLPWNWK